MADIEALLAALEDGGDLEEETTPPANDQSDGTQNATIKAIRDAQKKSTKDARDLAKALKEARDELDAFKTKEKVSALDAAFSGFELPKGVMALARKGYDGEATPEAVKQFLVDNELLDADAVVQTGGTTEEKSKGFTPGGTGQGAALGSKKVTRDEWLQIVAKDPARGREMFEKGLVDTSEIDRLSASTP